MRKFLTALCLLLPSGGSPEAAAPPAALLNLAHANAFVVFPADCNANGDMLFGGKTLAEMDRCAAIAVRRLLYASPLKGVAGVTVGVTDVRFSRPGRVGDLLFVVGAVESLGEKSITVRVRVEREGPGGTGREEVAAGVFVFVALDRASGKSAAHGLKLK